uniref:Major facilitator superfamily (MFS) profile domain-containing protein n=1 Tax=Alexandrium monilatum TaxID=311494 RepID=A0A7S4W1M5_9DINO
MDGKCSGPACPAIAWTSSHLLCSSVTVLGNVDFGVIVPSLFAYVREMGGGYGLYGSIISAFMLCRMVCEPVVSSLSDRFGFKRLYLFELIVLVVGNLVYAFAPKAWFLLIGRMISGCGAAGACLGSPYFARTFERSRLTSAQFKLTASRALGTLAGPGVSFFVQDINFDLLGHRVDFTNAPPLFVASCAAAVLALSAEFFEDIPSASESGKPLLSGFADREAAVLELWRPGVCALLALHAVTGMAVAFLEAITAPMTQRVFHWEAATTSLLFALTAVAFITVTIAVDRLMKASEVSDRELILVGAVISFFGGVLVAYWWSDGGPAAGFTAWKFLLSTFLFTVCQPSFQLGAIRALFSKLIPKREQGSLQGISSAMYSLGNLVAPLLATTALARGINWLKWLLWASTMVNLVLIFAAWQFLSDEEFHINDEQDVTGEVPPLGSRSTGPPDGEQPLASATVS